MVEQLELRSGARAAFLCANPQDKVKAVKALWDLLIALPLDTTTNFDTDVSPGRPVKPELVLPRDVPRRSPYTPDGHAALVHSITHIEFNAINLALDAAWRFAGMPPDYYRNWLQVAFEEANHFTLLNGHLVEHGYAYGDFAAHDGLWTMAENTRNDVTARMALVPRTLEARGLDATPIIQTKLRKVGSAAALQAVDILDIILREEVGHVAIGNRWYHWLCARDGHDSTAFHAKASAMFGGPALKPPFNLEARKRAGFTQQDLDALPSGGVQIGKAVSGTV